MKHLLLRLNLVLLFVLCFVTGSAMAGGDKEYAADKIPAILKKDADAVVRKKIQRLEVKSERKAYCKETFAVTIFNKDGRDEGAIGLSYDQFHKLESLEGKLFDAEGNELRELEKEDIIDHLATGNGTLYDDARIRIAELYNDRYPYTVEYTYEYYYNGYLNWPSWSTRGSIHPVENTKYEILIPSDIKLRYWCNTDSLKPEITQDGSKTLYVWKASMQPKLAKDAYGEDYEDLGALVMVAPVKFELDGHKGSMESWKEFGEWNYELYKERDVLPEAAKKDVHELTDKLTDAHDKIAGLYSYLQKRSRYISIQLGIGGWQPFDAKYVHEHGYGDCKALANYMKALLKEAGITSYPVLIKAGQHRYTFINEFPSNHFNHVILCAPLEKDTVWLECTSTTLPAGKLGSFTENRNALMLTSTGGVVVHTPVSKAAINTQFRNAAVKLVIGGSGDVDSKLAWKGNEQFQITGALADDSPEDRRKWVVKTLAVPNFDKLQFTFSGLDTHDTLLGLSISAQLPKFCTQTGSRIFFQPDLSEKITWVPADVSQRYSPVRIAYPYLEIDTITYMLPSSYKVESLPVAVNLTTSFGSFTAKTVALDESRIQYIRTREIDAYEIPAKNYQEYRKFYTDIVKADRAQVVLIAK